MTDNVNNPTVPTADPLNVDPVQSEPTRTDGYNQAVKQGQTMKVVLAIVIFLILAVLVGYILMNYLGGEDEPEVVTQTVVPTVVTTDIVNEPTVEPTSDVNGMVDFSYPVKISDYPELHYVVSGKAISNAEQFPYDDQSVSSFAIRGDGYQLNVEPFSAGSEVMEYEDYVFLMKVGDETIARVKDNYLMTPQHQYRYVRTENFDETQDCIGIGPDEMLSAPCGYSHYVRGNEVQTFYILDITCDADEENVSKCDDIVKSLQVSVE